MKTNSRYEEKIQHAAFAAMAAALTEHKVLSPEVKITPQILLTAMRVFDIIDEKSVIVD